MSPRFLPIEVALAIHYDQINVFGGLHGLRDQGLLESALGQARQIYSYSNDLFETAAQYCVSIVKNRPFPCSNKITAAACMLTFLVLNKINPTLTPDHLFEWTLQVALGELERADLARLLQQHSEPV